MLAADVDRVAHAERTQLDGELERLRGARTRQRLALRDANTSLQQGLYAANGFGFGALVGASEQMRKLYSQADSVTSASGPLLILGEPGTEKTSLARSLHGRRGSQPGPFFRLCDFDDGDASFSRMLRDGMSYAAGGTFVVEDLQRLDSSRRHQLLTIWHGSDVALWRVVTATPDILETCDGRDFVERLGVGDRRLIIPPLRERDGDLPLLIRETLSELRAQSHPSDQAMAALLAYDWPGNLEELELVLRKASLARPQGTIELVDLDPALAPVGDDAPRIPGATIAELQRHAIVSTLEAVGGSTQKAAEVLGISVRTIQYRLRDYGMSRPRGRRPRRAPRRDAHHSKDAVGA